MVRRQPVRLDLPSDEEASGPTSGFELAQTFACPPPLSPLKSPQGSHTVRISLSTCEPPYGIEP
jgi:hypothetical protein